MATSTHSLGGVSLPYRRTVLPPDPAGVPAPRWLSCVARRSSHQSFTRKEDFFAIPHPPDPSFLDLSSTQNSGRHLR